MGGYFSERNPWQVAGDAYTGGLTYGYAKQGGMEGLRKKLERATGFDDGDVAEGIQSQIGKAFKVKGPKESAFRGDQKAFINALQMQAQGQGPSLANMVADQQRTQGLNQLLAMQASQRGVNPALAARTQQMGAVNLNQQIAQQAMQGRAQEQLNAQNLLGNALIQARQQDQALQGMKMDSRLAKSNALAQALMQQQQLNAQGRMGSRQIRAGQTGAIVDKNTVSADQVLSSGGSMGSSFAGMAAMSDSRAKTNIEDISANDVKEFFQAIRPSAYTYTEPTKPGRAEGDRLGFMLQDVQNTKIGKKLIKVNDEGLMTYDRDNLIGVVVMGLSVLAKAS